MARKVVQTTGLREAVLAATAPLGCAEMVAGVAQYAAEVRAGVFPGPEHVYSIDEAQPAEFRAGLQTLDH